MPMIRMRRSKHRALVVSVMLFAWLFSLSAAWAQACLQQASPAVGMAGGMPHHGAPLAVEGGHDHADGVAALSDGACKGFCENAPQAIAKQQPAQDADSPSGVLPVAAAWPVWQVEPGATRVAWLARPSPPRPAPIERFGRLRL